MNYQTPADLAGDLQVSTETVRQKARSGEWPSSKIGKLFRFDGEDIQQIRELIRTPKTERVDTGSVQDLISKLA